MTRSMGDPPKVHCASCAREWRSQSMADGLRLVGSCPRCGGELVWAAPADEIRATAVAVSPALDPHLVLGLPRR